MMSAVMQIKRDAVRSGEIPFCMHIRPAVFYFVGLLLCLLKLHEGVEKREGCDVCRECIPSCKVSVSFPLR